MASNEDGFMSDESAFAEEDGYVPESAHGAESDGYEPDLGGGSDGYEPSPARDLSIEDLLDGAADGVPVVRFLDPDMGPVNDDVGTPHATLAGFGFLDPDLGPVNEGVGADALGADGVFGFNFGKALGDLGNAAGSLVKGAAKAAGAVAKGVGQEVTSAVKTTETEAKEAASTAGKVAGDVVHGNIGGAVKDVTAGAKAVAATAAAGLKDELAHAKATAQSVAQDVINGVAGAEKSLIAMVSQFSPEDLVEMVEKDFDKLRDVFDKFLGGSSGYDYLGADKTQPKPKAEDPNSLDLSAYQVPRTGAVASLFPAQYRGQLIRWVDARKNAGTIIWYLAGLALVDALHLRNKMLAVFGIKSADAPAEYGFAPLAALAGSGPQIIMIIVAVLTIAVVIIKALAGPNTVAGKAAKDAAKAYCSLNPNDPQCQPGGALYDPPAAPPPPPPLVRTYVPPTGMGGGGHSSSGVTFAVVAIGAVLLILFLKSQEE